MLPASAFEGHGHLGRGGGFSLLELITVLLVILMLATLAWPALLGLVEVERATRSLGQLCATLDSARCRAVAEGTHVWVGFAEVADGLLLSCVASKDGSRIFNPNASAGPGNKLDASRLIQLGKLTRLQNTRFAEVSEPTGVGSLFDQRPEVKRGPVVYRIGASTPAPSRFPFQYPVGSPAPAAQHLFTKTLQFDPRGQVVINGSYSFVPWLEIAIAPIRGPGNREAVVQVAGLAGNVQVFRK